MKRVARRMIVLWLILLLFQHVKFDKVLKMNFQQKKVSPSMTIITGKYKNIETDMHQLYDRNKIFFLLLK